MFRIRNWILFSTRFREYPVKVNIEVFGQLLPGQPRVRTLELQEERTARSLALSIGLEAEEIGMVTINGAHSRLDDPIQTDARICFFPYITGG
jgi:molybdopterin converting factor small subunit